MTSSIRRYKIIVHPDRTEIESYFVYKITYNKIKIEQFNPRDREYYQVDSCEGVRDFEWFAEKEDAQNYFDNIALEVANVKKISEMKHSKYQCKLMVKCRTIINTKFVKVAVDEYVIPESIFNSLKQGVVEFIYPVRKDLTDYSTIFC